MIHRLRPSPSMAVALVALFLSLGGVSYGVATGFIDSREIKNNTIKSGDVRNSTLRTQDLRNNELRGFDIRNSTIRSADVALNTLTGADVDESKLGQVPSAAQADNAAAAGTVAGLTPARIAYSAPAGTGFARILDLGGLVLEADCSAGSVTSIRASTSQVNSAIAGIGTDPTLDDGNFDPGETRPVDSADAGGAAFQVSFRGSGGATVTVQLYALGSTDSIPGGGLNDCGVFGNAFAG
jgi:hypothetical protein